MAFYLGSLQSWRAGRLNPMHNRWRGTAISVWKWRIRIKYYLYTERLTMAKLLEEIEELKNLLYEMTKISELEGFFLGIKYAFGIFSGEKFS